MPFVTRPHFEDRQIVQYNEDEIKLSGTSKIAPVILDFTGTTTGATTVEINGLTGYLNGQRQYGFVVEPAQLKMSGTTGTTEVDVTGYVLTAMDSKGSVGWIALSGGPIGNTYVNSGSVVGNDLILNWNTGGSVPAIALPTSTFTGNTSASCITDIYVKNIHSCSPLNIQPNDEGNVYFGSTSGVTIDISGTSVGIGTTSPLEKLNVQSIGDSKIRVDADIDNLDETKSADILLTQDGGISTARFGISPDTINDLVIGVNSTSLPNIRFATRSDGTSFATTADTKMTITNSGSVGIGTTNPAEKLHVSGGDILIETSNGKFYTDLDSAAGPGVRLSGNSTDLITIGVADIGIQGMSIGTRGDTEPLYPGYGNQGDGFLYSSAEQNGLNIISQDGTNKDDYIRLYAGKDANGTTSDIHIQGSGTTKGNVGINTESPDERLHIEGSIKIVDGSQSLGYVLTSDKWGVGSWQPQDGAGAFTSTTTNNRIIPTNTSSNSVSSDKSSILGGDSNTINTNSGRSIITGGRGNDVEGEYSFIGNGMSNSISGRGSWNTVINGESNDLSLDPSSDYNTVVGNSHSITGTSLVANSILGGQNNNIHTRGGSNPINSSIVGGSNNTVYGPDNVVIIGGEGNLIDLIPDRAVIAGGNNNNISGESDDSFIGGGDGNIIDTSGFRNSIVGGQNNNIEGSTSNSVIIGGNGITGTSSNTVYVPNLNIGTIGTGTSVNNLGIDVNGNVVSGASSTSGTSYWVTSDGGSESIKTDFTSHYINSDNSLMGGGIDLVMSGANNTSNTMLGGEDNKIISDSGFSYRNNIFGGEDNTMIGRMEDSSILGGVENFLQGYRNSIIGGEKNSINGDFNSVILGGSGNTVASNINLIGAGESNTLAGTTHSAIIGGVGINGGTDNTLYVPNLTVREDKILHSDTVLEVVDLPSTFEDEIKGSYTSFNWTGLTTSVITNNDEFGYTSYILGDLDSYPTNKKYGFISYYNEGYEKSTAVGSTTSDFYSEKLVLKAASDSEGMVISPHENDGTKALWVEHAGNSIVKILANGPDGTPRIGVGMDPTGVENALASFQIGGTGNTASFRYLDGQETDGYVLKCDSDGYATWEEESTFTGNTSATCITDLYVSNVYGCSPITIHNSIQSSNSSATGTTSFAFGENNKTFATSSFAFGTNLGVNGERCFAGGGIDNIMGSGTDNAIIGGDTNAIGNGNDSVIIGGTNNTILSGIKRAVILGGQNITASKDDQVHAPSLNTYEPSVMAGVTVNGGPLIVAGQLQSSNFVVTTGSVAGTGPTVSATTVWAMNLTGANTSALPDGDPGQRLSVYVRATSGIGNNMDITPVTLNGATTITLTGTGSSVELIYDFTSGWTVMGGNNYTLT